MYPLPCVLINCPANVAPELRAALIENGVGIAAECASVDEALATASGPPEQRRLLVVRVGSLSDCEQLARLDAAFPGSPVLALVAGEYDTAALFRVSRAGAAQLLACPPARAELETALDRVLIQFGLQKMVCKVIAVSGVTEGGGATTVALNLAAELPHLTGGRCVLAEFPHGPGRLAGLLNLTPELTTADLLVGAEPIKLHALRPALTPVNDALSVLVGPYRSLGVQHPAPGGVPHLIRLLRQVAGFAVLDVPSVFDDAYFQTVAGADHLVLVARQDVPSIQAVKLLVEALRERKLPDPVLVLNCYDSQHEMFTVTELRGRLGLKDVCAVRSDASGVRNAANAGKLLRELAPSSHAVRDLHALAVELLRRSGVPIHEDRHTVWNWVREKLGLRHE